MSGKKVRRRRDDGVWGGPGSPGGNAERLEIEGVSEDSIVELREAFNLFNIHSADKIPSSEIVSAMRSIGFSEKNPMFVDYLLAIDQRRQGTPMTFDEYAEAITSMIK
jgi:Ca2+-binding EF-hand superfamily protein